MIQRVFASHQKQKKKKRKEKNQSKINKKHPQILYWNLYLISPEDTILNIAARVCVIKIHLTLTSKQYTKAQS